MVRGCVWGAWAWLCDHGHLSRAEGGSRLFDQLEAAYQAIGRQPDKEAITRRWLVDRGGPEQLTLQLG